MSKPVVLEPFASSLQTILSILPRGHGRIIPLLARVLSPLHSVHVDLPDTGIMHLDLRECVCVPVFVHGCYRHQLQEDGVLRGLIQPGMTVFDIGANIGFYTRMFSQLVGPQGRVVAVEPAARALRILERNCADLHNVILIEGAVGADCGRADIVQPRAIDTAFIRPGTGPIEVTTLDHIASLYGIPQVIKIDVEGAELLAFRGGATVFATRPLIMFEYADLNLRFGGYAIEDLVAQLPAGYAVSRIGMTNNYLATP